MGVLHSLVCTGFILKARWLKPDYVMNYRFPRGLVGDKSRANEMQQWNLSTFLLTGFSNELDYWNFYCYILHARCFPVVVCWFSGESWFGLSRGYLLTSWHNQATSKIVVKPLGVCSHCKHAQYPKTSSHANVKLRLNKCSPHTRNSL